MATNGYKKVYKFIRTAAILDVSNTARKKKKEKRTKVVFHISAAGRSHENNAPFVFAAVSIHFLTVFYRFRNSVNTLISLSF